MLSRKTNTGIYDFSDAEKSDSLLLKGEHTTTACEALFYRATMDAARKSLAHQRAPYRSTPNIVELAPHASIAQQKKFVLWNIRPWDAEDAFSAAAASAWID